MIYDYKCSFGHKFTIYKSIKDYESGDIQCQFCEALASREYKTSPQASVIKDFEPNFYHSFGKVFNTKKELQYHVDKNNMVHVGNDFSSGESMQKSFEKQREDRRQKAWGDL